MKLFKVAAMLGVLAMPAMALAHTFGTAYDTRGQCEAALAEENHNHAVQKVESGESENMGEAMRWMHDRFSCERTGDFWYFARIPG